MTGPEAAYLAFGLILCGLLVAAIVVGRITVSVIDAHDVPHGRVSQQQYFSRITGNWRRCFVYTPPDYDGNDRHKYPVLYLLHGWGEDETGWYRQGHVDLILDNLIHSINDVNDLAFLDYDYIRIYEEVVSWQMTHRPSVDALFIGGGGYTLPRRVQGKAPKLCRQPPENRSGPWPDAAFFIEPLKNRAGRRTAQPAL